MTKSNTKIKSKSNKNIPNNNKKQKSLYSSPTVSILSSTRKSLKAILSTVSSEESELINISKKLSPTNFTFSKTKSTA